ncbi:hypothetical protein I7U11_000856 [Campylobacter coli]|nr:hypothetical protein [Campylobacter coli]EGS0795020.1 hypothetical protein [Campylobacter coli]
MSYNISYIPSDGQNEIKPPINPIKPNNIDMQRVQELINENIEKFKNEINGGIDDEKIKDFIQDLILKNNFLQFIDISDEQNPNRKTLQIKNHDSISSVTTNGDNANLLMLSKTDAIDFGSSKIQMNLNSKDGIVKINDNKIIATIENLDELKNLISNENLSIKISSLIEGMKDSLKGEKGDTPSTEEISAIVSEVIQDMNIGANVEVDENQITEAVNSISQALISETLAKVSNIEANTLSAFINAIENKTLLCNITNTDAPALLESGITGYKQGFIWINESASPQKMWISDVHAWTEINLTKINEINKIVLKVSRNNINITYSACTFSNFGLITTDGNAIFAKSSTIGTKSGGTCVFEIDGVDYTATFTTDLGLYSNGYTFNIVMGNNKSMLSNAIGADKICHFTLTFDKALPTQYIQGFGVRPYGNVVTRDWTPKMILEACNTNIPEPIFSLEKYYTTNSEVEKSSINALSIVTGKDISKKVTSYSDWSEVVK